MRLARVVCVLLALIGLTSPSLLSVPAQAADTGTLSVTVVDWNGDPMAGQIFALNAATFRNIPAPAGAVYDIELPVGDYAVLSFSPWGGFSCAGVTTCGYAPLTGDTTTIDGSVAVVAGKTTTVTIRGETPVTITGRGQVGQPLTAHYSAGLASMLEYVGVLGGEIYADVAWKSDGKTIAGASGPTYTPTAAESGSKVSVELSYTGLSQTYFSLASGGPVPPVDSNSIAIRKIPTSSFALLLASPIPPTGRGRVRVEVTAAKQVVAGRVKITAAGTSRVVALRNGTARTTLPKLAPGRYPITCRYLGTSGFAASKAKTIVLTVSQRR